MIRFTDLPEDMQCLIHDFVGRDFDKIPEFLPSRMLRIADIPVAPLDEFDRGTAYARRLTPENSPPLIIADNHILDGKHRCFSFRELGVETFEAVDLSGLAEPEMIKGNSLGELCVYSPESFKATTRPRRQARVELDYAGPGR